MEYYRKYNELSRDILGTYVQLKKGNNVVLSPYSVIMLLGIAASSTAGATRDEIVKTIGGNLSFDNLQILLKELQEIFTKDGTLISSNAVCVQEQIKESLVEGYADMLDRSFSGTLFVSKDIVGDVNSWVKEKTRGMIERIADDSMRNMLACLLNAAAFEADWQEEYEEDDIYDGEFVNADNSISDVQMMDSQEHLYIETKDFTGFVKHYKGMAYSYMALLPKKKGINALQSSLKELNFTDILHSAEDTKVFVTMPEYKYSFSENLTGLCQEMGIRTLFTPGADFSNMSREWLKVDSIIHKAHIEVDRKGTKAAAVTAAYVIEGALPMMDYKSVCLDRPFVYAIMHNETGLPVFCGVMNHAE